LIDEVTPRIFWLDSAGTDGRTYLAHRKSKYYFPLPE